MWFRKNNGTTKFKCVLTGALRCDLPQLETAPSYDSGSVLSLRRCFVVRHTFELMNDNKIVDGRFPTAEIKRAFL